MEERIWTDMNGQSLIIKHRKSAVFFERLANVKKPNKYGSRHELYVCRTELRNRYVFSEAMWQDFHDYCRAIGKDSWPAFSPKKADSLGAEYDDYYDKEFDNNGSLSLTQTGIEIEGPYTQLKSSGNVVRLIKFNKRKFESFVYDISRS